MNLEKTLQAQERTNKQLYSHMIVSSVGLEPGSPWLEVSALTITPPMLPLCFPILVVLLEKDNYNYFQLLLNKYTT